MRRGAAAEHPGVMTAAPPPQTGNPALDGVAVPAPVPAPLVDPPAPLVDPPAPPRIVALDVLRGFALTGIAFVNVETVTGFRYGLPTLADPSGWLQLLAAQRFFPLFSLLFGISFSLIVASAERRGARPRLVLLRRLLVLLPLGVLHWLLQPGEALTPYAVVGLLVLLPSTWLPRWVVAVSGGALLSFVLFVAGGGIALIPGLFLVGSALVRYGVVARVEDSVRVPLLLFVLFAIASVPALVLQRGNLVDSGFSTVSAVAGAAVAGAYATGVLLLLRTPLRQALIAAFAPLGRMALTNYVSATVVMVIARYPLRLQDSTSWTTVLGLAAGIIVVQAVVSTWWLARFRYGPLEWLWRWATWGSRPAFAR